MPSTVSKNFRGQKYSQIFNFKKTGYRVLIAERHLIFYKVNETDKSVIIYAIVDGRREYLNNIRAIVSFKIYCGFFF